MSDKKWKVGDVVELANKEGGFTDPQTGFDISRDQKMELKDRIGTLTNEALVSGGLLVVTKSAAKSEAKSDAKAEQEAIDSANEKAASPAPVVVAAPAAKGSKKK
jgi:hypothetical protein